jgi:hypothetical protein
VVHLLAAINENSEHLLYEIADAFIDDIVRNGSDLVRSFGVNEF